MLELPGCRETDRCLLQFVKSKILDVETVALFNTIKGKLVIPEAIQSSSGIQTNATMWPNLFVITANKRHSHDPDNDITVRLSGWLVRTQNRTQEQGIEHTKDLLKVVREWR